MGCGSGGIADKNQAGDFRVRGICKDSEGLQRAAKRSCGNSLAIRMLTWPGPLRIRSAERKSRKWPVPRLGLLCCDAHQEQKHHKHRQEDLVHSLHHPIGYEL